MPSLDDRPYHVERARAELDAAYRAQSAAVAAAHLKLCALHMRLAREMRDPPVPEPVAVERDWLQRCAPMHEKCLA